MNLKKIFILSAAIALSVLLSGCSASAMNANSWSGLSADADNAYLANGSFVYAIDLGNGRVAWQYPAEKADTKESFFATPVLTEDGQLLIASAGTNHTLASLNPANGNTNWTFNETEGIWLGSPIAVGEIIYAPNTDGKLYALDLNGNLLWKENIGGALWAQPVSDGNILYITSLDHHLYAFDMQKKEVIWQLKLSGSVPGSATLGSDGQLYLGSFGSAIVAVDPQSQDFAWKTTIEGWVWDAPVLDADTLYVGDLDGYFYAINTADGSEIWDAFQPGGPITGTPLVTEDFIVIATETGTAYAIDREGSIVWKEIIDGKLYTAPVQGGDLLLFSPMETETDIVLVALDLNGNQVWEFTPAQ